MPAADALYGDAGLTLEIAGTQYECDATEIVLEHEEDDRIPATMCEPVPVRHKITITSLSTTVTGSFWTYLWINAGTKNIPFTYVPWGNLTPTPDEPHLTGFIDIPKIKPSLGGEAGTEAFTFEVELLGTKGTEVLRVTA